MLPRIEPPFFETGPKNYLYGQDVVDMARCADETARRYDVRLIYTAPYANLEAVASLVKNTYVFAPHMDDTPVGRGLAWVLPESIRAAGARGVCLNHSERPVPLPTLCRLVARARALSLYSEVCAGSSVEIRAVAQLQPDILIAEPEDLIGSGSSADTGYVSTTIHEVRRISPSVSVLVGGGVSSGEDVYRLVLAGADATGCASGIFCAEDPPAMMSEMLRALRQAWDERKSLESQTNNG